nr:MAG TPA: hypothetical protein [Bacteriophage sp.]
MSCGLALHNDEMYNQQPYIILEYMGFIDYRKQRCKVRLVTRSRLL